MVHYFTGNHFYSVLFHYKFFLQALFSFPLLSLFQPQFFRQDPEKFLHSGRAHHALPRSQCQPGHLHPALLPLVIPQEQPQAPLLSCCLSREAPGGSQEPLQLLASQKLRGAAQAWLPEAAAQPKARRQHRWECSQWDKRDFGGCILRGFSVADERGLDSASGMKRIY